MLRKFIAKFELAKHIHINPYCKYDIRLSLSICNNSLLFVNTIYLKNCDQINVISFSYSSMPQKTHYSSKQPCIVINTKYTRLGKQFGCGKVSIYIFHNVLWHTMSTIKKYTHNNTSPNKKFENVLVSQNTNVGSEKNSIVKEYVYVIINNVTIYLCITEYTGTMI